MCFSSAPAVVREAMGLIKERCDHVLYKNDMQFNQLMTVGYLEAVSMKVSPCWLAFQRTYCRNGSTMMTAKMVLARLSLLYPSEAQPSCLSRTRRWK